MKNAQFFENAAISDDVKLHLKCQRAVVGVANWAAIHSAFNELRLCNLVGRQK